MMDASELIEEIDAICVGSEIKDIAAALNFLLVRAIMLAHDCTDKEAVGILIDRMNELKRLKPQLDVRLQ